MSKRKNGRGWVGVPQPIVRSLDCIVCVLRSLQRVPPGAFAPPECKFHESAVLTAAGAPVQRTVRPVINITRAPWDESVPECSIPPLPPNLLLAEH